LNCKRIYTICAMCQWIVRSSSRSCGAAYRNSAGWGEEGGGAGAGSGSQASLKRILEMDAHTCMSSTAMYKAVNMKNMQAAEPQVCFSSSNISLRARQTQHCVSAERPEV